MSLESTERALRAAGQQLLIYGRPITAGGGGGAHRRRHHRRPDAAGTAPRAIGADADALGPIGQVMEYDALAETAFLTRMFDLGPSYVPLPPELADAKVRLRPPRFSDYRAWQALREHSRAFLEPWEPVLGERRADPRRLSQARAPDGARLARRPRLRLPHLHHARHGAGRRREPDRRAPARRAICQPRLLDGRVPSATRA